MLVRLTPQPVSTTIATMSDEDTTKSLDTQPGVTAILERINALDEKWDRRFQIIESRLDRVESMTLEMRADLRDLRATLKEHLPAL